MSDLYTDAGWRQYDDLPPRAGRGWWERNLGSLVRLVAVVLLVLLAAGAAQSVLDLRAVVAGDAVPAPHTGSVEGPHSR